MRSLLCTPILSVRNNILLVPIEGWTRIKYANGPLFMDLPPLLNLTLFNSRTPLQQSTVRDVFTTNVLS
jgi:hypothetical protein